MDDLEQSEQRLYQAVVQRLKVQGFPPSYRELADDLDVRSISTISRGLHELKKKGYVDWSGQAKRTLRVLK